MMYFFLIMERGKP